MPHRPLIRALASLLLAGGVVPILATQPLPTQTDVTQPQTRQPRTEPDPIEDAQLPEVAQLDEVIVQLVGGRRVVGLLVEQNEQRLILRLSGVEQTLPADKVTQITTLPPVLERYEAMRTQIAPDDFASLLQLALWLEQRERYALAIHEVDRALAIEPTDQRAMQMHRRLVAKRALAEKILQRRLEGDQPKETVESLAETTQDAIPPLPRLDAEQINLIRVFEIDLAEPPQLTIDRSTIERLIHDYNGDGRFPATPEDQRALFDADPVRILALLFDLRARELYPEVRVAEDPASMHMFREQVHRPLIINSCATSGCHADSGAGRLRLIRDDKFSDATVYTNFLILERFKLDDGSPLVDYAEPANSPLLQMALERDISTRAHPVVPGPNGRGDRWHPAIRSTNDRRFQAVVDWINAMYHPRPDYPIELDLPEPAPQQQADNNGPPR